MNRRTTKEYIKNNEVLLSEWDWERNSELGIYPDELTSGSHKKVWWKCSAGHSWASIISNRARLKRGCPYCAGQKPIAGKNDLLTTHLNLAKEWNYARNGDDLPQNHMSGSQIIVWWKCTVCNQEWKAQIKSRSNGVGCPYCAGKKVLVGVNDLATIYPKIAAEWHTTKNGELTPKDVTFGSGRKVWWECKNGHEWEAVVCNRINRGCPICSSRRRTSFPEQAIYYYIKMAFPDAQNSYKDIFSRKAMELDIYIPSLKVGIEYDGKQYHTSRDSRARDERKYQICKNNEIKLIRITDNINAEQIINCDIKIVIQKINDYNLNLAISQLLYELDKHIPVDITKDRMRILDYLTSTDLSLESEFPHVAEEWNYERNKGLFPSMFHPGSNEKVWWKCSNCGKEWKTSIAERTGRDKTNCPECSKKIGAQKHRETVLKQKGSIAETHAYLLEEWDYSKNDVLPENVTAGSGIKVWWVCKKCGNNWQTTPGHRTYRKSGCPCCRNIAVVAGKNDMATTHPQLLAEWDYDKNIIKPTEIVAGSGKKAWWICSVCGHRWKSVINTRAKGCGCPSCAIDRRKRNLI